MSIKTKYSLEEANVATDPIKTGTYMNQKIVFNSQTDSWSCPALGIYGVKEKPRLKVMIRSKLNNVKESFTPLEYMEYILESEILSSINEKFEYEFNEACSDKSKGDYDMEDEEEEEPKPKRKGKGKKKDEEDTEIEINIPKMDK